MLGGYLLAVLFLGFIFYTYSRNLLLKSRLDEAKLDYENLLSDKLRLERSYSRLKENRTSDIAAETGLFSVCSFQDSLLVLKRRHEAELARLNKRIGDLEEQINHKK